MKNLVAALICAVPLCGCGLVWKMDALSDLDTSRKAYRDCAAEHKEYPSMCEAARLDYQADLADAERTRGVLTSWPRL